MTDIDLLINDRILLFSLPFFVHLTLEVTPELYIRRRYPKDTHSLVWPCSTMWMAQSLFNQFTLMEMLL